VGISDPTTPWAREAADSLEMGVESVVLFALDQYCLIGYSDSRSNRAPRSVYLACRRARNRPPMGPGQQCIPELCTQSGCRARVRCGVDAAVLGACQINFARISLLLLSYCVRWTGGA